MTRAQEIDVRQVHPTQRHALIFSTFDALAPGGHLDLVNDHDPVPLYRQFEARHFGHFDWQYLETGPERWQVRISKRGDAAPTAPVHECCSCSCQGQGH